MTKRTPSCSPEVHARAVRMVLDPRGLGGNHAPRQQVEGSGQAKSAEMEFKADSAYQQRPEESLPELSMEEAPSCL